MLKALKYAKLMPLIPVAQRLLTHASAEDARLIASALLGSDGGIEVADAVMANRKKPVGEFIAALLETEAIKAKVNGLRNEQEDEEQTIFVRCPNPDCHLSFETVIKARS